MSKFKIDILLPAKESFSATNAGAVATVVNDLVTKSTRNDEIRVIGSDVDIPFPNVNFCGLKPRLAWFYGNNAGFVVKLIGVFILRVCTCSLAGYLS